MVVALPPSQPRTAASSSAREAVALPAEALAAHDLESQLGAILADLGAGVLHDRGRGARALVGPGFGHRADGGELEGPGVHLVVDDARAQVRIGDAALRRRRRHSPWPAWLEPPTPNMPPPPPPPPPPPMPLRSCCSRRLAMVQPPFSGPTRFSFGTFTSVKKVSQNGEVPAISWIGRTSTPGRFMSISRKLMPSCFLRGVGAHQAEAPVGPLRAGGPDLLAVDQEWSPLSSALVCSEARSEPAPGSEKPWHQRTSPRAIGGMWRLLLLLVAVFEQGRAEHHHAHAADRVPGADARSFPAAARAPAAG